MGKYLESPLPNTDEISNPSKWWTPTEPTEQVLRLVLEEPTEWIFEVQTIIAKGYELKVDANKEQKIWDLKKQSASSMLIPIFKEDQIYANMVELFAGGFGGWRFANQYLMQLTQRRMKTLAIEKVMTNCMQYAIQHDAVIFDSFSCMEDFDISFLDKDHIYHGDVRDLHWQKHVPDLRPLIWTVSAPCPPWSSAGKEEGFSTEQGQLMAHVCCLVRVHRPKYVLLEQVANFAQHSHYKAFVKLMFFAGYRFVNTNQVEFALQSLAPVRRNRFLAWLVREEDAHPIKGPWVSWKHAPISSMYEYGAFLPSTPAEQEQFKVSFELKLKYMNPVFLPPQIREKGKHPLQHRVPGHFVPQGTFMSMYGHQHEICDEVLAKKGLFGQFCSEAGTYRFFKPQEIALLHTVAAPVMFLSVDHGWKTQGDCITVPHALWALANVWAQEQLIDLVPDQVIESFIQERYRADFVNIQMQEGAIFMARNADQIHVLQARWILFPQHAEKEEPFVLQPQRVWHPNMGQVEIRHYLGPTEHQIPFPRWIEEVVVSPTQPFAIDDRSMQLKVVYYDDRDFACKALVDSMCTIEMVHHAWHFLLGPIEQTQEVKHPLSGESLQIEPKLHDQPIMQDFVLATRCVEPQELGKMMQIQKTGIVFVMLEDEIFLLCVENTCMVGELVHCLKNLGTPSPRIHDLHDAYGILAGDQKIQLGHAYFQVPLPALTGVEWRILAQTIGKIEIECRTPSQTDHLVLQAHAESSQVATWHKLLVRICSPEWLERHGRVMQILIVDEEHVHVVFVPNRKQMPLPIAVLKRNLTIRLVQAILLANESEESDAVKIRFKYENTVVHAGRYDVNLQLDRLLNSLATALALEYYGNRPRLVSQGTCIRAADELVEILNHKRNSDGHRRETMISMQPPLFGGAPGSKREHLQAIHTGLATLAMQFGVSVHDVPYATQKLFQEYGQARLHHLLFTESEDDRQKHFRQLCEESNIMLQFQEPADSRVEAKFGRQKKAKQYQAMKNIQVEDYEIQEGYFVMANGQNAPILNRIAADVSGVCMMTPEQAAPWMIQNQVASCDPLAIFVAGQTEIPQHCRCEKTMVPALDRLKRGVLLAGYLVQIGTGTVHTLPDPCPEVPTKPTGIAAFTFWRDEHNDANWLLIREAPVKQAKLLLRKEGLHESIRSPWARSFRSNKQVVPPSQADSIQFHAEIDEQCVSRLVRASGLDGLYVTPKTSGGTPDPRWKPLWLTSEEAASRIRFQTARGFAGFVRTEKNMAIRLEIEHFPLAWKQMRPDKPQPSLEYYDKMFRVGPFAFGTTPEVLHQWLSSVKWSAQPLKMLQSRQWLFAAKESPPQTILQFNGQPLLVAEVTRKNARAEVTLAAGPKPQFRDRAVTSKQGESSQESPFRTGDPFFDPWRAAASAAEGMKPEVSSQGPIASTLQSQDAKIHALEQTITQMQTKQNENAQQANNRMQNIENALQETRQESLGAFANLRQEIQATVQAGITQAVAAQEDRMAGSIAQMMTEFRQMCHRGTKRQPSPDDDMRSNQSDG